MISKKTPTQGIWLVCANQVKKNTKLFGLTALSAFFIGASMMSSPAVARDKLNYKCDSACLENSQAPTVGALVISSASTIAAPPPSTPTPHAGGGGGGGSGGGGSNNPHTFTVVARFGVSPDGQFRGPVGNLVFRGGSIFGIKTTVAKGCSRLFNSNFMGGLCAGSHLPWEFGPEFDSESVYEFSTISGAFLHEETIPRMMRNDGSGQMAITKGCNLSEILSNSIWVTCTHGGEATLGDFSPAGSLLKAQLSGGHFVGLTAPISDNMANNISGMQNPTYYQGSLYGTTAAIYYGWQGLSLDIPRVWKYTEAGGFEGLSITPANTTPYYSEGRLTDGGDGFLWGVSPGWIYSGNNLPEKRPAFITKYDPATDTMEEIDIVLPDGSFISGEGAWQFQSNDGTPALVRGAPDELWGAIAGWRVLNKNTMQADPRDVTIRSFIFKIKQSTKKVTIMKVIDDRTDPWGGFVQQSLTDDGQGNLWGIAASTSQANSSGYYVSPIDGLPYEWIYKINKTTGAYSVVYEFLGDTGDSPATNLVNGGDGYMYGTTMYAGSAVGAPGGGFLFKIKI